ncbi:hypothetical protein RPF56_23755, partial [Escherichia coli]
PRTGASGRGSDAPCGEGSQTGDGEYQREQKAGPRKTSKLRLPKLNSYRVLSRKNRLNSVVQPLSTASRLVSTKFPILRGYANGVKRAYLYYIIAESLYGFAEQGVTGEYSLSTG